MTAPADSVRITRDVLDAMLAHARSQPGTECCGLLAGAAGVISAILPAKNARDSATAFEIAPLELFELFRRMRDAGLDHLGIYHSHPRGNNAPSPTDIEQSFYPETAHFILSPQANAPNPIRAFHICGGRVHDLIIVEG